MSNAQPSEDYSVGRVAELAGVTVRTLHHYDEIGLVRPGAHSPAGYRLYSAADVERLQQVLIYRRLGFSLEEIAPATSSKEAGHATDARGTVGGFRHRQGRWRVGGRGSTPLG